ncbi:MAG: phosphate--acyl-ACP acyltransferase, partial [Dehalococcoidia bacterium]
EPRVALLSIGEESSKGSMLVIEAHELLSRDMQVNFVGNIESRELLSNDVDVIVTDGFTGNVSLKVAEGIAGLLFDQLRQAGQSSLRNRIGAGMLLPSLRAIRDRMDYRIYGAVPLLGVRGGVFIGHGRSDGNAVLGALRTAQQAVQRGMLTALEDSVER